MSGLREADVIKKAQQGEPSAVGVLFDSHQEAIYRFVWIRVRDHHVAEDLTGEVFMRMVAELPRYENRSLPFRAWLYRIAYNLIVDTYRADKRYASVPLEHAGDIVHPTAHLDEMTEHRLTTERVQQALDVLDPAQREVVELRFLAGLSLKEAAATLNKTVSAVKALQHRGLHALRLLLHDPDSGQNQIALPPLSSPEVKP